MVVERHVCRLSERRAHRIVAACSVRRIPVRDGRPSGDVKRAAVAHELGVVENLALLRFVGVDASSPPADRDSAPRDCAGGFHRSGGGGSISDRSGGRGGLGGRGGGAGKEKQAAN